MHWIFRNSTEFYEIKHESITHGIVHADLALPIFNSAVCKRL